MSCGSIFFFGCWCFWCHTQDATVSPRVVETCFHIFLLVLQRLSRHVQVWIQPESISLRGWEGCFHLARGCLVSQHHSYPADRSWCPHQRPTGSKSRVIWDAVLCWGTLRLSMRCDPCSLVRMSQVRTCRGLLICSSVSRLFWLFWAP